MNILLASASPRRRQLLEQVGLRFSVQVSEVPEVINSRLTPAEAAVSLAADKAAAVAGCAALPSVVIGADTIVVFENQIFGKPADAAAAKGMLSRLSGQQHKVITGIAVAANGELYTDYVETLVQFRHLTASEIDRYIATGEPMDKAGAYAIQGLGALFVERIEGCYANVVGLPLVALSRLLLQVGVRLI